MEQAYCSINRSGKAGGRERAKSKKEKEGGTGRFYLYASMCTVPF
jgi:hypothetical protein